MQDYRHAARNAIAAGFDRQVEAQLRNFFYLPFMHSEDLADQRYSEQLAALRWLGGTAPMEQGRCRRLKAAQLWQGGQWAEALQLQLQLVQQLVLPRAPLPEHLPPQAHQVQTLLQAQAPARLVQRPAQKPNSPRSKSRTIT